jgi:hypothetical protein
VQELEASSALRKTVLVQNSCSKKLDTVVVDA